MKSEKKYIYICTRLYNYNDKIQAEYLEEEIISNTPYNVFVPFRDSNEHLLNGPNKTRLIYDTDIEKLNSSQIVLLAVLFIVAGIYELYPFLLFIFFSFKLICNFSFYGTFTLFNLYKSLYLSEL